MTSVLPLCKSLCSLIDDDVWVMQPFQKTNFPKRFQKIGMTISYSYLFYSEVTECISIKHMLEYKMRIDHRLSTEYTCLTQKDGAIGAHPELAFFSEEGVEIPFSQSTGWKHSSSTTGVAGCFPKHFFHHFRVKDPSRGRSRARRSCRWY